jgi:hypothetical protein
MRTLFTQVNEIGEPDGGTLEIGFEPVTGWDTNTVLIERNRIESFLARVGAEHEGGLVGLPVRVTVDDDGRSEHIVFLAPNELAEEPPPSAASREPAVGAIPVVTAERVAAFAIDTEVDPAAEVVPVATEAGATLVDRPADPCAARLAPATRDENAQEEDACGALETMSSAPPDARLFLYRETYGEAANWDVFEVTANEYLRLIKVGGYIHDDGCVATGDGERQPDPELTVERLLDRVTARQSAGLSRAEVERLSNTGHVISCSVY